MVWVSYFSLRSVLVIFGCFLFCFGCWVLGFVLKGFWIVTVQDFRGCVFGWFCCFGFACFLRLCDFVDLFVGLWVLILVCGLPVVWFAVQVCGDFLPFWFWD